LWVLGVVGHRSGETFWQSPVLAAVASIGVGLAFAISVVIFINLWRERVDRWTVRLIALVGTTALAVIASLALATNAAVRVGRF
jgi:hypothetical protein